MNKLSVAALIVTAPTSHSPRFLHQNSFCTMSFLLPNAAAQQERKYSVAYHWNGSRATKYILGQWALSLYMTSGHALGIWICRCSLFYRRELWVSKSAGFNSTKSLKICRCKRWCPKDLRVRAPAAPVLTHSLKVISVWERLKNS